jgi:hypothetical protein
VGHCTQLSIKKKARTLARGRYTSECQRFVTHSYFSILSCPSSTRINQLPASTSFFCHRSREMLRNAAPARPLSRAGARAIGATVCPASPARARRFSARQLRPRAFADVESRNDGDFAFESAAPQHLNPQQDAATASTAASAPDSASPAPPLSSPPPPPPPLHERELLDRASSFVSAWCVLCVCACRVRVCALMCALGSRCAVLSFVERV